MLVTGAALVSPCQAGAPIVFTSSGNLSTARAYHTENLLLDGRVLVTGGSNGLQTYSSTEIYDPATKTWSYSEGMSTRRLRNTATMLPDGRVSFPADWTPNGAFCARRNSRIPPRLQ